VRRPSAAGLARAAVAIGLTAAVLWASEPRQVLAAAANARFGPLLGAIALVVVDRALMAYRWLVLLRPLPAAARPPFGEVLRVFFVSTFVGTFLPASVGGDAVRAVALSRLGVPAAASVASVFMDRALGVLSVLVMAAVGLWLAADLWKNLAVRWALLATAAGCLAIAVVVFSEAAARFVARVIDALPSPRLRRAGHALLAAVQEYARHHGALVNVLAGSVAVQVLRIVQGWLLGRALGVTAPLWAYFAFIPLILLVMLLPVTVNGLGTSQAAFVWFFGRVGVPAAPAFALSVLFVALGVVGNLPGGILFAWNGGRTAARHH
jgi:uncharacterized protein (TIRG00374 family)